MFPQLFGKYVLEREIAAGGMARVYLATLRGAVGFEKRLVVKQIRSELASDAAFVARFVEEAKTAVELSHPNIVPVYELGVEQGVYYIAMELCEGLTLSDLLRETGPLGPTEGAYLGAEICRALDYAHRRAHIVHRDVTPRNVLIDEEGAVRLIDFGIAAPVTLSSDTGRREIFGSPGHMPPEQLYGAALTPATDVFAVGALLIEAWTGRPPFRRATAEESERALLEPPSPIEASVPQLLPLSALIASSVALDARDRPSAAEHLARPLREFSKSEDSGDIARRLAARVQRARAQLQAALSGSAPQAAAADDSRPRSSRSSPTTLRESVDSDSLPVTRTFAARDDLQVWTRKLSSVPAPPSPAPASELALADATAVAQWSPAPRRSTSENVAKIAAFWSSQRVPWLVAALSCAALAVLFASRAHVPPPVSVESAVSRSAPALPPALASSVGVPAPVTSSGSPSAARALPPTPPAPRGLKPSSAAPVQPAAVGSSALAESLGELRITADPRAQVTVTGVRYQKREQTPIFGLKVPAGNYEVVFSNDTVAVPLSARVVVVAGGTLRVHADFRRAEPSVRVQ